MHPGRGQRGAPSLRGGSHPSGAQAPGSWAAKEASAWREQPWGQRGETRGTREKQGWDPGATPLLLLSGPGGQPLPAPLLRLGRWRLRMGLRSPDPVSPGKGTGVTAASVEVGARAGEHQS